MADVTISQLNEGVPDKGSAIIPYSDGTTTFRTAPSGIVAASPGCVLQVVQVSDNTTRSTVGRIPADSSIPQITEGDLFLSLNITPKSASSQLLFFFEAYFQEASNTSDFAAFPLFKDNNANAIHVWLGELSSNVYNTNHYTGYFMYPNNTTNTTTYSVRWSTNNNGQMITLGNTGYYTAGLYGRLVANRLIIQEIAG